MRVLVEGTEDADYYRGKVTGPTRAQVDWVRAHRPQDPTLSSARPVGTAVKETRS